MDTHIVFFDPGVAPFPFTVGRSMQEVTIEMDEYVQFSDSLYEQQTHVAERELSSKVFPRNWIKRLYFHRVSTQVNIFRN